MSSMKIDEFISRWQNIASAQGSYQRIDAEHPLDFYIGKNDEYVKELILITEYEPSKMKSSKSVEVVKGKRFDEKWAIQVRLVKPEQEDVFIHLCWDLIESSRGVHNQLQGLETVIARFVKWQKLMEYGSGGLVEEAIKGLIGELIYAKQILVNKYDLDTIISSWLGPEGADRDFVFNDTWTEVKTISTGKLSIGITSMEQLDTSIEGVLAVLTLDNTSPIDNKGFSFASVIDDFRTLLRACPNALLSFEEKLVNVGYYEKKEYAEKFYRVGGFRFFRVNCNFPKLTREMVRNEISRVNYEIILSSIINWEIEVNDLWNYRNTERIT